MAPVASTIASHLDGVSDSARARELYKYYQPDAPDAATTDSTVPASPFEEPASSRDIKVQSDITASKIASPDTALTAFCQLTAWRTGAQRAMISVIDAETQHFIAEGTKTVDLVDNTLHAPGDDIWMGCGSVTKAGRLCERTIAVEPTSDGDYPVFIVDDLSIDDRFNTLPFVTGPPFIRFYAGVPLITKRGIPIGSLFVVDDRVGKGLTQEKAHFMGTMAVTIMKHMEMVREVEEHRRGMKMSRCLASFVEGRAQLVEAEVEGADNEGTKIVGQFEPEAPITRVKSKGSTRSSVSHPTQAAVERDQREYSAALSRTEEDLFAKDAGNMQSPRPYLQSESQQNSYAGTNISLASPAESYNKSGSSPEDMSETTSMKMLFSRAANLIREAFEVDGGVVFLDAHTGFSSDMEHQARAGDDLSHSESGVDAHSSGDELPSVTGLSWEKEINAPASPISPKSRTSPLHYGDGRSFSRTTGNATKECEILSFSTCDASSIHGDPIPSSQSFSPLSEKSLTVLLRRYPRGKLWTFDSDGAVSSSSEEEGLKPRAQDPVKRSQDVRRRKLRSAKAKTDARVLSRHFPGVRQLLFVPLWDSGPSRWLSACFAWSTEPTRVLSKQSELAFLSAFGNSVMAEWSRIDTEIADQKKGDFIGSISHELRSPLHGILASAEFLEEITTGWEKGLVETIDSCGRTLLDTINHILDFSKINHFENNWRKTKRAGRLRGFSGKPGGALTLQQSDLPMLNLFQDIDISILCEEVVESVFAGHVFQHSTAQSFDRVPNSSDKMSDARKFISSSDQMMGPQKMLSSGVAVILDVEPYNYHFITQPGALRRLIMNLLGNALKYTSHGYVNISLTAKENEDFQAPGVSSPGNENIPRSIICLTVRDTGKGISPEFLRSKLFMPFAQENSLSSGTGLGLSIVRKIVSLLEGEITIDSEVGRGTRVRVTLPLLREMPPRTDSTNSSGTQQSIITGTKDSDQSIVQLRSYATGYRVSLHGFDLQARDPVAHEMDILLEQSISNFLVQWYGMRLVPLGQTCDIIISNEGTPSAILSQLAQPGKLNKPSIVVLCSHSSRFDRKISASEADCNVGFVAKPVGPLKLAKAITQCLHGAPSIKMPRPNDLARSASDNPDLSSVFEELSMSPRGGEILDNTRMSADSANARKAIESPTPNAVTEKAAQFPFPSSPASKSSPALLTDHTSTQPSRLTEPLHSSFKLSVSPAPEMMLKAKPKKTPTEPLPKINAPTLLLVDDNQINIRLLSTYLTRRNYSTVHEAMDGLQAVQKVEARPEGYDIIFMDITMPVLDGFGATRQIRAMEQKRREAGEGDGGGDGKWGSALIIAFTGRSSIEDQTEAVRVGIDLFMTKPVAFKEVGKIIDNWLANREKERAPKA